MKDKSITVFYETPYAILQMEKDNTLVRMTYTKAYNSINVSDELYKEIYMVFVDKVQQLAPTKVIVNMKDSSFGITPELQEWTVKEVSPKTRSVKKVAFVISEDIYVELTSQQMMNQQGIVEYYETRYFVTEQQAEAWLNE